MSSEQLAGTEDPRTRDWSQIHFVDLLMEIPQASARGLRNCSEKPGFAQQNAPKKRKGKPHNKLAIKN
jgi:hypothetical protein